MDTAQTLLLVVVILLSSLLLLLGVQVFFILRELRRTIIKANTILDQAATITENIAHPITNISTLIAGLKTGASLMKLFHAKPTQSGEETHGETHK